jgi:hypothetical protein
MLETVFSFIKLQSFFWGPIYLINHIMRTPCNNKAVRGKGAIPAGYLSMHRIYVKGKGRLLNG